MVNNILAKTIFTVHSYNHEFVTRENNTRFLVRDEEQSYAKDIFASSRHSTPCDGDTEERTPAPEGRPAPFLRITTDRSHFPHDHQLGFVFGSDESCDILLDENQKNGISGRQFAIKIEWDSGGMIFKNHSRQGTNIESSRAMERLELFSQRTLLQQSEDQIHIKFDKFDIQIRFPDHSNHWDEFRANWVPYCAKFSSRVPGLHNLALESAVRTPEAFRKKYRLDGEIGRGTSGTVYRAQDIYNNQFYAAKVYHQPDTYNFDEIKSLTQLVHKHIVRFHAFVLEENQSPLLMMEFINGDDLQKFASNTPLETMELKLGLSQLLDALSYIHSQHITHRDIKPANIMVQSHNPLHLKLTDFGLASTSDHLKTYCGTVLYAAPELMARGSYDNKVDIWSLGIIALQYSYGLPPYSRETRREWPIILLDHLASQDSHPIVQFISCLLQADPNRRPSALQSFHHPFFYTDCDPIPRLSDTVPNQLAATICPPAQHSAESTQLNTQFRNVTELSEDHGVSWDNIFPRATQSPKFLTEHQTGEPSHLIGLNDPLSGRVMSEKAVVQEDEHPKLVGGPSENPNSIQEPANVQATGGTRTRTRTGAQDKSILEDAFNTNPKPDKATIQQLATRVSLSEKQVTVWFRNRRCREKARQTD
ncbi:kinase-like domain-containing protein [Nemania sp. FL0916]|nr:kinase-like domain-containing protein [Nemania sp. FL0916]